MLRIVLQEERVEKKQYTEAEAKKVAEKKALEILQKSWINRKALIIPGLKFYQLPVNRY